MKRISVLVLCIALTLSLAACGDNKTAKLEGWSESSPAAASITAFVKSVTDEGSETYVPEDERIAVFDVDGTLLGERFPTYFDQCMLIHRLIHDDTYKAPAEYAAFATNLEGALLSGAEEPDSPKSTGQIAAESFKGFTAEEYSQYVKEFLKTPVPGFENMTYADGFFKPMVSLVKYLDANGFTVYISSGAERMLVRAIIEDELGGAIPPRQVIGSTFSFEAEGQSEEAARDYNVSEGEKVVIAGDMIFKNLKLNKIVGIINEIGAAPILAFGNSSGDFSMGRYVVDNGGKAYMLLCDDEERDFGDAEEAAKFAEKCEKQGFETISMKDEFETIFGQSVVKKETYTG